MNKKVLVQTLVYFLPSHVAIKGDQQASEFTHPTFSLSQALTENIRYTRITHIADSPSVLEPKTERYFNWYNAFFLCLVIDNFILSLT